MNSSIIETLRNKNSNEKICFIDEIEKSEISDKNALKILEYLAKDEDVDVRVKVAETLVFFETSESEKILISMLTDSEEMVRVNACDSLYIGFSTGTIDSLKETIKKDKSSLVRAYAAISICDIALKIKYDKKGLLDYFESILSKEKVKRTIISFYSVIYRLGKKEIFPKLIAELNNKLYTNRCAVISSVRDMIQENQISNEDLQAFVIAANLRLKIEKARAVISSIQNTLDEIEW